MAQRGNKNALNRDVGADGQRDWRAHSCTVAPVPVAPLGLPFVAWQHGVPVWSLAGTNNASATCRVKAPLSWVGVHTLMAIVPFTAAWQALAYPGLVIGREWGYLFETFRLVSARISAHATAFVGVPLKIALRPGVVLLASSRRSTVK